VFYVYYSDRLAAWHMENPKRGLLEVWGRQRLPA